MIKSAKEVRRGRSAFVPKIDLLKNGVAVILVIVSNTFDFMKVNVDIAVRWIACCMLFNFLVSPVAVGQVYNPFWTHTDRKMIRGICALNFHDPRSVEHFFRYQRIQPCLYIKDDLGFGWSVWNPGIGAGYITAGAWFYYRDDSLVSYSIEPRFPTEKKLLLRYEKLYTRSFDMHESAITPYYYHPEVIQAPLAGYSTNKHRSVASLQLLDYMSPLSGTEYGYAADYGILPNRKTFLQLPKPLGHGELFLMMHAINPASRLTAVEYYLRHKDSLGTDPDIEARIQTIFQAMPEVKTTIGCFQYTLSTEWLVTSFRYLNDSIDLKRIRSLDPVHSSQQ